MKLFNLRFATITLSVFILLAGVAYTGLSNLVTTSPTQALSITDQDRQLATDPKIVCVNKALGLSNPAFGPNINNTTLVYWDQRADKYTLFKVGKDCGLDFPRVDSSGKATFSNESMESLVKRVVGQPVENQSTYRHVNVEGTCSQGNVGIYRTAGIKISEDIDCNQPELGYKVNYWWNVRVGDTDAYTQFVSEGIGDGGANGFAALICASCAPAATATPTPTPTAAPTPTPIVIQQQQQQQQTVIVNQPETKVLAATYSPPKQLPATGNETSVLLGLASLVPFGLILRRR